jgi:hypothetical protein
LKVCVATSSPSSSMHLDPDLLAEISRLLGMLPLPPHAASHVRDNDLFEQFVFGLLVDAARAEGASVSHRSPDGRRTSTLCFRISPGWIYRHGPGYTHALIAFDGKIPLEAHIGIRLRGSSEVEHECDVVALLADHAIECRTNGISPASKSALIAIECKHLAGSTDLNYARSFVGLARDLTAKHEFFVTNSTSRSVERILHEQRLKWERNVRPINVDVSDKLRSAFREVFKGYIVGKFGTA